MEKVKFVWDNIDNTNCGLTLNKIYDVLHYSKVGDPYNDTIQINDDRGDLRTCYLRTDNDVFFIEALAEYRTYVIDGILE